MKNWMIQDFLPRVPIVTHGWSSDGSYACLKNSTLSMPRFLFSRVPDTVLVGPSSLGSAPGRHPLKTGIPLTGYNALLSGLKREARPRAVGMATKEIGSNGNHSFSRLNIWSHPWCPMNRWHLSKAALLFMQGTTKASTSSWVLEGVILKYNIHCLMTKSFWQSV